MFGLHIPVGESRRLLGQSLVQFSRAVEERLNRRSHLRQQHGDIKALLRDRPNLGRKIMGLGPAGELDGQVMQGAQRRPGLLQPPCYVAVRAARVVRQRHAANSRVKDNRILRHVG